MDRLGVRQLRNTTAEAIRRAGAGERIVITVDGRPVAQLGPIEPPGAAVTLDDLVARGLLVRARRADRPAPSLTVHLWAGGRLDRVLADVRGKWVLALDTSALLARFLAGPARAVVLGAMAADTDWCASALALTEALLAADRVDVDAEDRDSLRRALHDDWQRIHVVPIDAACLDRAAELGHDQPLRAVDALHLAAADRLPRPVSYCTFDPRQIPVALALGFTVVST